MTTCDIVAAQTDSLSDRGGSDNRPEQSRITNYRQYRTKTTWTPCVNICEDNTSYWVIVDLAGVTTDEIDIHVDSSRLTISGIRHVPQVPEIADHVSMHLMEIDSGEFARTLDLPANADLNAVEATYGRGYLKVRIPKKV